MSFDRDALARSIRGRRAEMDITQAELAERAGVNITTIGAYESGERTPGADKLFAIADALGCTPNDLMGWKATA